jgi:hypothetical protein
MAGWNQGKASAAAQRMAERRERENNAPRLHDEIPALVSLRLQIEDHDGSEFSVTQPKYARTIMVPTAPALFLIPCTHPDCIDGGHDVTGTVMRALRGGQLSFSGDDACHGNVGSNSCSRTMHYVGAATYEPTASKP